MAGCFAVELATTKDEINVPMASQNCVCYIHTAEWPAVSRLGLAGKRKDAGSTPRRFGSPVSSKIVIYGHCLVTLPCCIINETLKCLTSLAHLNTEIILVETLYSG